MMKITIETENPENNKFNEEANRTIIADALIKKLAPFKVDQVKVVFDTDVDLRANEIKDLKNELESLRVQIETELKNAGLEIQRLKGELSSVKQVSEERQQKIDSQDAEIFGLGNALIDFKKENSKLKRAKSKKVKHVKKKRT